MIQLILFYSYISIGAGASAALDNFVNVSKFARVLASVVWPLTLIVALSYKTFSYLIKE